jgi:ribonuclease P protein component
VLPAGARLRRSEDFRTTTRRARGVGRGALTVHLLLPAEPSTAPARAGFVVSRRVGGAVVRNRVRRQLRHLVADRLDALPPGSALVVRAHPQAAASTSAVLGRDLDAALQAARRRR